VPVKLSKIVVQVAGLAGGLALTRDEFSSSEWYFINACTVVNTYF
jgi:hypothetical protein